MGRKDRCVEFVYKNGKAHAKICHGVAQHKECEEFEYEILTEHDKQILEEKLADLIAKLNEDQVLSCVSENCIEYWELWSKS